APAQKLGPLPLMTIAWTSLSASASHSASPRRFDMVPLTALWRSGRLRMMRSRPRSFSRMMLSSLVMPASLARLTRGMPRARRRSAAAVVDAHRLVGFVHHVEMRVHADVGPLHLGTAVDEQGLAGHPRREVRREEQHGVGDVLVAGPS